MEGNQKFKMEDDQKSSKWKTTNEFKMKDNQKFQNGR